MDAIKVGSLVCWKCETGDEPARPVRRKEIFRVVRCLGNGRCDLMDRNDAELFNIPLNDLQRWQDELSRSPSSYRHKMKR